MKKVACVVVTYNRLTLLQGCIDSIRKQTFHDFDIIVVNNGSTDGTKDWLQQQTDIVAITQGNSGGAGGFYTGQKEALQKGYEWIWMMDDDGIADHEQLGKLLKGAEQCNSKYVNALVCNIKDPESLAFGLVVERKGLTKINEAQKYKYIKDSINPFNGTLIHREILESVGLIKKEMFIWGDEMEYTYRAKRAGYQQFTITSALHFHPAIKSQQINIFPFVKRYRVDIPANKSRAYIKYRNNGYLCKTYYPSREFKEKMKYTLYFLSRLKFLELIEFYKFFNRGMQNIF